MIEPGRPPRRLTFPKRSESARASGCRSASGYRSHSGSWAPGRGRARGRRRRERQRGDGRRRACRHDGGRARVGSRGRGRRRVRRGLDALGAGLRQPRYPEAVAGAGELLLRLGDLRLEEMTGGYRLRQQEERSVLGAERLGGDGGPGAAHQLGQVHGLARLVGRSDHDETVIDLQRDQSQYGTGDRRRLGLARGMAAARAGGRAGHRPADGGAGRSGDGDRRGRRRATVRRRRVRARMPGLGLGNRYPERREHLVGDLLNRGGQGLRGRGAVSPASTATTEAAATASRTGSRMRTDRRGPADRRSRAGRAWRPHPRAARRKR